MRRICNRILVGLSIAANVVATSHGQAAQSEYALKAAFLYNFTKFVDWPGSAFSGPSAPLVIAVLGPDPFGDLLERTVAGKTEGGRRIQVRNIAFGGSLDGVHILFVPQAAAPRGPSAAQLAGRPILVVGESAGSARSGAQIGFVITRNRIGFEINAQAARGCGLTISSRLLQLARTVY